MNQISVQTFISFFSRMAAVCTNEVEAKAEINDRPDHKWFSLEVVS